MFLVPNGVVKWDEWISVEENKSSMSGLLLFWVSMFGTSLENFFFFYLKDIFFKINYFHEKILYYYYYNLFYFIFIKSQQILFLLSPKDLTCKSGEFSI